MTEHEHLIKCIIANTNLVHGIKEAIGELRAFGMHSVADQLTTLIGDNK